MNSCAQNVVFASSNPRTLSRSLIYTNTSVRPTSLLLSAMALQLPGFARKGSEAGGGFERNVRRNTADQTDGRAAKVEEMMLMMADLQISQDRTLREHSGQLNKVVPMPMSAAKFPQEGAKVSKDYQLEARTRQQQTAQGSQDGPNDMELSEMGSPHVKVALVTILTMVEEMTNTPLRWGEADPHWKSLNNIKNWWIQEIQNKDEAHVHEQVQIFKISKPQVSSAGWRRKGIKHKERMPVDGDEDDSYFKIELCLLDKKIQKDFLTICMELGGVIKEGTPPPNKQIRMLKKALQDMKRR